MPLLGSSQLSGILKFRILEAQRGRFQHRTSIRASNADRTMAGKNHYQVLGLKHNATPLEIKTAFRQLVHKYHPDVNKSPDSSAVFKSVRLAYEVLADETRRKDYNRTLHQSDPPRKTVLDETGKSWEIRYGRSHNFGHYDRVNFDMRDYERKSGRTARRRRRFTPTWVRKVIREADEQEEFDNSMRESAYGSTDWFQEWQRSPSMIFAATWISAVVWQFFGIRSALAALGLSMCSRSDISTGYRLALAVACLIGGAKGVLVASSVLILRSLCGVAYDTAVLVVVSGIWLRESVLAAYVYLPPPLLLLMAYKLVTIRPR